MSFKKRGQKADSSIAMQREIPPPEPFVKIGHPARKQRGEDIGSCKNEHGQGRFSENRPAKTAKRDKAAKVAVTNGQTPAQRARPTPKAPISQDATSCFIRSIAGLCHRPRLKISGCRSYIGFMPDKTIRIASYNIRKARGLDNKRRPDRILQVINALDADVVVLQEADRRLWSRPTALPRQMIETDTDFTLVEVNTLGDVEGSIGWHGNAVLLREGMLERAVERLDLPGLEPRGAVRVTLDTGLVVVATHLGLLRRSRQAQLCAIRAATAHDPNVVIAGDFNEWSAHRGLEPLAARFTTHSPGRSFHARRPLAGLDRFALSEGLELRDAGVQQGQMAKVASDHLPVWADVTVPAAASSAELFTD